jgi:hypothetical protein
MKADYAGYAGGAYPRKRKKSVAIFSQLRLDLNNRPG